MTVASGLGDVLAGGASSPVRAGRAVGGEPFIATRGAGAYQYDDRGRRYIDYIMAYGPLLLGHGHPAVSTGLDAIAARGVVYGSTTPDELVLAERIRGHLPAMERLRFTTTGSEAVMSAIRVARAFTGRDVILKFAGNYHGHFDLALLDAGASALTADASRSGIPAAVTDDLRVARYNDLASVDALLAGIGDRLAAIVVEPIVGNMGLVFPRAGFLEGLVERAHARGLGGAQTRRDIVPDLVTVGKIVGGGFPLAAFGGRADVMAVLAPEGACFTGGTHAGNPFAVALGLRTLDWLESHPEAYVEMDRRAKRLARGIESALRALGLDYAVLQDESIVDFKFRPGPPTENYDDAKRADRAKFAAFYHAMRERGILLAPSQNEVMFLSVAHSDEDVDETIAAAAESLAEMRSSGVL